MKPNPKKNKKCHRHKYVVFGKKEFTGNYDGTNAEYEQLFCCANCSHCLNNLVFEASNLRPNTPDFLKKGGK